MLPETNRTTRQLALLIGMCALAPILNWAGSMVTTEQPNPADPRSMYRQDIHAMAGLFFYFLGALLSFICRRRQPWLGAVIKS